MTEISILAVLRYPLKATSMYCSQLSDEENVDHDIGLNQTVHIDDVVKTLEVHTVLPVSELQSTTSAPAVTKSGAKKRKLCENQSNWRKQEPIYTKFENTPSSTSTVSVNDEGKLDDFKNHSPTKLFEEFLDDEVCSLVVTETVRQMHGPNSLSLLECRRFVATTFLKRTSGVNRPSAATFSGNSVPDLRFDKIEHFIGKKEKQRRCRSKDCKVLHVPTV
ncbi:hypothetical protein ILUMI_00074 [Ignelater luminosus]|uniref:Uncharacterized protein n=1 Tax=Ignelater luminosus TaxID=2038154 RepID=A0A8K0GQL5_IGNLU|nr:hypothetical protein ILUMI_00074 [Ignelater luminosus]